MDRRAALASAAGLVLVVAGAASALSSTWTQGPTAATTAPAATVITEYVDEAGNPVAPPAEVQAETVIFTRSPAPEEIVVFEEPTTIYVDSPSAPASGPAFAGDHEDDHEDEDEHGDEDEHEDEDEHGDEDEHEDEDGDD